MKYSNSEVKFKVQKGRERKRFKTNKKAIQHFLTKLEVYITLNNIFWLGKSEQNHV
jgi:hypothetical protein